jgi:hypothetical protein
MGACLLYVAMQVTAAQAYSPPPPQPSPPKIDHIPGTPSLSLDLSETQIRLTWNATEHAEYYPVYAYTNGQWQHIEDIHATGATYDYKERGWEASVLRFRLLACKTKPWWLWLVWWEHDRCSSWSNTESLPYINQPPVANAGDDRDALAATELVLNGSNSYDTDGTLSTYHWQQVDNGGPIATINNPRSANATITLPDLWQYDAELIFRLTVTDNHGASDQDEVTVLARPTPGVIIRRAGGHTATPGRAAEISISLASQPVADVTIPIASSDESEGVPEQSQVTFTPENWRMSQTVIVRGTNENVQNGQQDYQIQLGPIESYDLFYNDIDPQDITLRGIELSVSEPDDLYPLIAGREAQIYPRVFYTDNRELSFSLTEAPEGMGIDRRGGWITWTPQPTHEGQSHTVTVSVSDGNKSATLSFEVTVAEPQPVATEVAGNRLSIVDNTTSLEGVSITQLTTDTDALAALELTKLDIADAPELPDYITPLTDIFVVRDPFDHEVELRFAIPSLPDNISFDDVELYSYGRAMGIEGEFWSTSSLKTSYEGSMESPIVVIKVGALESMFVFGYNNSKQRRAILAPKPLAGKQADLVSSQPSSPASQSISCNQSLAYPPDKGPLDKYLCTTSADPDVKITLKGFGTGTRWQGAAGQAQGATKEELISWLIEAQSWFANYSLGYKKEFEAKIEQMPNSNWLGFVTTRDNENRNILHLTDNNNWSKSVMQATAAHEYFHHAQGHPNTKMAGKQLLINETGGRKKWLTEGTAVWFEDELYDSLNNYKVTQVGQGRTIAEVGINSKPDQRNIRTSPYQRFSFFKLLNKHCSGFTQNLKSIFNVQSIAQDPSGIKNLTSLLGSSSCNFGNHLGVAKAASLEAALAYYNYVTQFRRDISLLDVDESNMGFTFDRPGYQFSPAWSNAMDSVERTLNGVSAIPAAGAVSFYVPEIAGNLPPGKEAQLVVESNSELMVSITSSDNDFTGTDNSIGNHPHTWFSTANKTTYSYDANGTVPELFVTVVNPSLDHGATVDVSFKLSDRFVITAPRRDTLADSGYTITYNIPLEEFAYNKPISLHYDTDNSGYDGNVIVDNLIKGTPASYWVPYSYTWDTSSMAEGDYYVYAKIDNGEDEAIFSDYSTGKITVYRRYTRLNADGSEYTGSGNYSTEPWACVRENVNDLIWEVKTNDGGIHDKNHTYPLGGLCYISGGFFGGEYIPCSEWSDELNVLVDGSNTGSGLCGFTDWRVPSAYELVSLVPIPLSLRMPPIIDTNYFPNTNPTTYWSSTPNYSARLMAQTVNFYRGSNYYYERGYSFHVRLVRDSQ